MVCTLGPINHRSSPGPITGGSLIYYQGQRDVVGVWFQTPVVRMLIRPCAPAAFCLTKPTTAKNTRVEDGGAEREISERKTDVEWES